MSSKRQRPPRRWIPAARPSWLDRDPPRPPRRRPRRHAPEVFGLERRELMTVVPRQAVIHVRPGVVPPTGGCVPVVFSGSIASTRPQLPEGYFHVTDQYRRYEPFGPVALTPLGPSGGYYRFDFRFTIAFPTQRSANVGGRHYSMLIGAEDHDNSDGRTVTVFVPPTYPPPGPIVHGQAVVAGPRPRPRPMRAV